VLASWIVDIFEFFWASLQRMPLYAELPLESFDDEGAMSELIRSTAKSLGAQSP